ncbi:BMP family lipoprotein [Salimicrobium halophilum]|uniref:Nucleoside-binding protein n=1 Tax=Salimicrobium halophilum TaxID=86666 RepID=A0A1G8VR31_9BACI|nr:BMP family ABC transporter substrate-binding protein [Salimicrobium halophilum]SDJ68347.1 nucleoside-binding protein [Salimicrobium halophilum]
MKYMGVAIALFFTILLTGCAGESAQSKETFSAGLVVTDSGLGDNAFSDLAFQGLEQARDELGITFDYREPLDGNYEEHLRTLVEEEHDVIIGLSFNIQEAMETVAKQHPDQKFVLIDAQSSLDNITSITFKEDEGSYLIGMIAGMKTQTDTVGFIGGEDIPVIHKFEDGFKEGVQAVNPDAEVLTEYSGTFGDDQLGKQLAEAMIEQNADYIFPSAGFTGVGALQAAEEAGIYAFGVDSDQHFLAEDAVVTSMTKNLNVAIFDIVRQAVEGEELTGGTLTLGLAEEGVGLAPIRLIDLSEDEQRMLDERRNAE